MRTAFINTLHELAEKDKRIYLLNGDLGFSVLEDFTRSFPNRSLNMGVSEANMMGAAAGLAMSGKIVFIYSIVPFVTARVYEQIRNDIALQRANVKIVGVGSGLTYGQLGPTHYSIDDISIMRSLPNMTVVCPGDPMETTAAVKAVTEYNGPVYLRIGKKGEPIVHRKIPPFEIGKGIPIKKGRDCTLIVTGNMLDTAIKVVEQLGIDGIGVRLLSFPTVKPLDDRLIKKAAKETSAIFTLEEHSIIGGLGSAVAEVIAENRLPVSFYRFGIPDQFPVLAGSQEFLRSYYKLSVKDISEKIKKIFLNSKHGK